MFAPSFEVESPTPARKKQLNGRKRSNEVFWNSGIGREPFEKIFVFIVTAPWSFLSMLQDNATADRLQISRNLPPRLKLRLLFLSVADPARRTRAIPH
jgi:hypothetical protein